jgi:hypothetical protein
MVLHDLNNAARYSHHIVALADGLVYDAGPPDEVVTPDLLREVFGVEADVVPDPRTALHTARPSPPVRREHGTRPGGARRRAQRCLAPRDQQRSHTTKSVMNRDSTRSWYTYPRISPS